MNWTPDQVRTFFSAHWTVRKYKSFNMPSEHLDAILFAAQRAPTDATAQMYTIIHLQDQTVRQRIADLSDNAHIVSASEAFIICADIHRLNEVLKLRNYKPGSFPSIGIHFGIGDAVMAGENMLLAAELLGYRGCWIGGVLNQIEALGDLLQLPKGVFPFAGLTIGVPDEAQQYRPRLPRSLLIHKDCYQEIEPDFLQQGIDEMGPITLRGDWAQMLSRYFGSGGAMEIREQSLSAFLERQGF